MLSCFSHVQLFVILWTVACQGPLSMGFSRQEYWSGLPCPSPRGYFQPSNQTHISYVSCIGRQVLYHSPHLWLKCFGAGSLSFLQGIFPIQGWNSGLLYCGQILHQLSHKRSPRILEWVACPFSSRSSWPRNWTAVSCIAGGFFTNWAMREVHPMDVGNLITGSSAFSKSSLYIWNILVHIVDIA